VPDPSSQGDPDRIRRHRYGCGPDLHNPDDQGESNREPRQPRGYTRFVLVEARLECRECCCKSAAIVFDLEAANFSERCDGIKSSLVRGPFFAVAISIKY
jgi:hypothetical protein